MIICLTIPERYAAQTQLPTAFAGEPAELYVFPEGFLRSQADLARAWS